jgi:hypothetical protein
MSATLRLFVSARDVFDDRRVERAQRAHSQPRCTCCGRFASEFWFETICLGCMTDTRPTIMLKVDQARRWYAATRVLH